MGEHRDATGRPYRIERTPKVRHRPPYVPPPPEVGQSPWPVNELCRGARTIHSLAVRLGWKVRQPTYARGERASTTLRGRYVIATHALRMVGRVAGSTVVVAAVWADRPPPPKRVWLSKRPEPPPERKWSFVWACVREGTRLKTLNHRELKALLSTVEEKT